MGNRHSTEQGETAVSGVSLGQDLQGNYMLILTLVMMMAVIVVMKMIL
jgi:hypothetical protein